MDWSLDSSSVWGDIATGDNNVGTLATGGDTGSSWTFGNFTSGLGDVVGAITPLVSASAPLLSLFKSNSTNPAGTAGAANLLKQQAAAKQSQSWMKWALIGGGVIIAGLVAWMLLKKK